MFWTSRQRVKWIWIACFAVLMNALAPAVSQTLGPSSGDFLDGQICSAANVMAQDTQAPSKSGKHGAGSLAACGYCTVHAATFALPPPDHGTLALFSSVAIKPFLFYRAPKPLLALSAAPPRGPPAFA
jgi:hypothetical protein